MTSVARRSTLLVGSGASWVLPQSAAAFTFTLAEDAHMRSYGLDGSSCSRSKRGVIGAMAGAAVGAFAFWLRDYMKMMNLEAQRSYSQSIDRGWKAGDKSIIVYDPNGTAKLDAALNERSDGLLFDTILGGALGLAVGGIAASIPKCS